MTDWPEEPRLGQLIYELPMELERCFAIVGVEETGRPDVWWLTLERLDLDDFVRRLDSTDDGLVRSFVRTRR